MTYLKMVANAAWAGLYGSLLITFLIFLLNDDLAGGPRRWTAFLRLLVAVGSVYLPALTLLWPTLFACVRFVAARRMTIGWLSLKPIVWFGVVTLGALGAVWQRGLVESSWYQPPAARGAMKDVVVTMLCCLVLAIGLAAMGQVRAGARARHLRVAAGAALLLPPVVAGVMVARAPEPGSAVWGSRPAATLNRVLGERGGRLLVVGLDSASMNEILPLVAAGKLPALGRLIKEGASTRLDSISPCRSLPAWTTLATGRPPWMTGVKGASGHRFVWAPGGPSTAFRVVPRWLGFGALHRIGLVESVQAAEVRASRSGTPQPDAVDPPVRIVGWPGSRGSVASLPGPAMARVQTYLERILGATDIEDADGRDLIDVLRRAIVQDVAVDREARRLRESAAGDLGLALILSGLADVNRVFLRYHRPADFGDVSLDDVSRYGAVLGRYYEFLDGLIEAQIELSGPGARIAVVSAFGVEPVPAWERLASAALPSRASGGPPSSGSWRRGPDGLFILSGDGVAPGASVEQADVQDVLPTLLYLLGLPLERDLPGQLIRRFFTRLYLETHPVRLVPAGSPRV